MAAGAQHEALASPAASKRFELGTPQKAQPKFAFEAGGGAGAYAILKSPGAALRPALAVPSQSLTGTLLAKLRTMRLLLPFAALAPLLFALPARAQSTAGLPSSTAAPSEAARPAVNAAPSVSSAPRQDQATLGPAAAPRAATVPLPPTVPTQSTPHELTSWYGSQTLATDAAAFALLVPAAVAGAQNNDMAAESLVYTALGSYVMGAPIVHAAHGNWGRALGSLGLRIAAPIAGAFLGAAIEDCSGGDFCGAAGGVVGLAVGAGTAIALDAAVIARETVSVGPAVTPVVVTGKDGTWLGLSGRF